MSKMMEFSQLAFIVTDDCNFNCTYCPQIKGEKYIRSTTIEKAITFYYPFLDENVCIYFYGGEPLLAIDSIKYAVSLLKDINKEKKKKLTFSLTTNGSLITDEILHFFARHSFDVLLSFDGLTQETARESGSLAQVHELIMRFQKDSLSGIRLSTNSVFTPGTVNYLSASLQYIIESGVTDLTFTLAPNITWNNASQLELEKKLTELADFLVAYYKKHFIIPVSNFRNVPPLPKKRKSLSLFTCIGGRQRMAITPEEDVWGCYIFYDYFKNREDDPNFHTYWFGKLDDFINHYETVYPRILDNYTALRQDLFFTKSQYCFSCEDVNNCRTCPVSTAYTTSFVGKIPPWICQINRIQKKVKMIFLEAIDKLKTSL